MRENISIKNSNKKKLCLCLYNLKKKNNLAFSHFWY